MSQRIKALLGAIFHRWFPSRPGTKAELLLLGIPYFFNPAIRSCPSAGRIAVVG